MHTSDVNNSWYHGYLFEYWNNFSSFNKKQTIKTTPFQKISKQEQCFQIFVIHFAQDNEEHSFNETVLFFWGVIGNNNNKSESMQTYIQDPLSNHFFPPFFLFFLLEINFIFPNWIFQGEKQRWVVSLSHHQHQPEFIEKHTQ